MLYIELYSRRSETMTIDWILVAAGLWCAYVGWIIGNYGPRVCRAIRSSVVGAGKSVYKTDIADGSTVSRYMERRFRSHR